MYRPFRFPRRFHLALGLLVTALLTAICQTSQAGDASSPGNEAVFKQNRQLGRGVNIIGYDPLWRDRAKARFQAEHFRLIHEAGFNHVRINLHPFRDNKVMAGGTVRDEYWKTMDWAVEQCRANRLLVILDFHEFQEMAKNPEGDKPQFLAFWKQLAERYKDAPPDVLFEILNEPNGKLTPELWNKFLRDALAVIRQSNPTRTVIVGPASWNSVKLLDKLELPEADRRLIVTVHYYLPFEFTHQGASWAGQKKTGVAWNGTEQERGAIEKDFAKVQAWSKQQQRPIYLGEFGAYDKGPMESRVRWTNFVTRQAESLGWSWGYWQFDGDFIVYDIAKHHWVEPILHALIPARPAGARPSLNQTDVPATPAALKVPR